MKLSTRNLQPAIILLIIAFFLSACTGLTTRVSERAFDSQAEVQNLLLKLKSKNHTLNTFKGIGKITLWNKGKSRIARVAWIGSEQEKLRIEVLNVTGQPAISFASDEKWLYFRSHTTDRFYKKRSNDASLKPLILIPIKASDVVDLLAGRVPVYEHKSAVLIESGDGYVLVLKKKWRGIVEKIYLDKKANIYGVEIFNGAGSLLYRAVFGRMDKINEFQVPSKLVISNDDGVIFKLDIDKYWADVSVSSSIFSLRPLD